MTTVITDCGHTFLTAWNPLDLCGTTAKCLVCDALLIFPRESTPVGTSTVPARLLHETADPSVGGGSLVGYFQF